MTLPNPEVVLISQIEGQRPKAAIRIGEIIFSVRQGDDYALTLLDALGRAREFDGREPTSMKCRKCKRAWKTLEYGSSKCPTTSCRTENKMPGAKK